MARKPKKPRRAPAKAAAARHHRPRQGDRRADGAARRTILRADRPGRSRRPRRLEALGLARRIRLDARHPRRPHQGHRPHGARRRFGRHGRGAAARAAVRRADAADRGAGALQGRGALADAFGALQCRPRARAQRHGAALAAMDAGSRRHFRLRPARLLARARRGADVRPRARRLVRRRRGRARPHHGRARPRARQRRALGRFRRRSVLAAEMHRARSAAAAAAIATRKKRKRRKSCHSGARANAREPRNPGPQNSEL